MADLASIRKRLTKLQTVEAKLEEQIKVLQHVFVNIKGQVLTHDDDVVYEVIQYSQHHDIRVKKLVYLYLSLVAHINQDVVLHATNSIHSDLHHANPLVRGNTLRSLSDVTLTSESVKDFVTSSTADGLKDSNSCVRSIAVDAVIKKKLDLLDKINAVLATDSDPSVVVRCLECKAFRGDNIQSLLLSLIERISLVDDFLKITIISRANQSLGPTNEETMFRTLNALEPIRQQTSNIPLSVEASSLMLKVASENVDICKDVVHQIVKSLVELLHLANSNWNFVILCSLHYIVMKQSNDAVKLLKSNTKLFLVLFEDHVSVKMKKLDILTEIVSEEFAEVIFINVLRYITANENVARKAFCLLTKLHMFLPRNCETVLTNCLQSSNQIVVQESVKSTAIMTLRQTEEQRNKFLAEIYVILLKGYKHCTTIESNCSSLWLLSQNGELQNCGPMINIMNTEVENFFDKKTSPVLQQEVLTTCMRLFLKWPHLFEKQLKDLFEKIFAMSTFSTIQEQAKIYFLMLKSDLKFAQKCFEPCSPIKSSSEAQHKITAVGFNSIKVATLHQS